MISEQSVTKKLDQYSLDGVPVFGEGDPTVQMSGGVEQPLLADPMGATFLFSNLGICEIRLTGMVNQLNIEAENQEIIRFDGIKKALVKKFGDVILSDNYNLSVRIWNVRGMVGILERYIMVQYCIMCLGLYIGSFCSACITLLC